MASLIKLNKGLDINLAGAAEQKLVSVKAADKVTLVPDDFVGSTPKVVVKAGEAVKAGDVLFTDKLHPEIKFVSPVSGTVEEVVRGERRKVLGVVVVNDGKGTSV
nr:NADH:ubiquinone reductase (Na(+)-transporting) subunit A [Bacteroidales bacterium]